jgi:exodeoxyribonuclease VII large subunit
MIGSDPTFSVSEFVAVFNQSLETIYPQVGIVGELANFRVSKGKWVYFDLKDENSSVKFFATTAHLPGPLQEGMNLEVFGFPRLHQKYGFSINVDRMRVVGEGSIAKAKQLLERKLRSEGLFDESRKRLLPYPPSTVGLITSVESAAYSDFIKVLNHRWGNLRLQLADCLVQGADAPGQIVEAVQSFNQLASTPEVLVLIRGGGSADDLDAFNAEQVVRSVAASRIPTMVAVGHERDLSLAELAADKRASTPSNAAELLVPDRASELSALDSLSAQLGKSMNRIVKGETEALEATKNDLTQVIERKIEHEEREVRQRTGFLRALEPTAPLKRGFALVRNRRGRLVRSIKNVRVDDKLSVAFSDGQAGVRVLNKKGEKNGRKK